MSPILSYNGLLQALQTSRPSTNSGTFPSLSSAPALGLLVSCLNYPPSSDLNQFVNLLPLRHSTFSPRDKRASKFSSPRAVSSLH